MRQNKAEPKSAYFFEFPVTLDLNATCRHNLVNRTKIFSHFLHFLKFAFAKICLNLCINKHFAYFVVLPPTIHPMLQVISTLDAIPGNCTQFDVFAKGNCPQGGSLARYY
jgi:hypothetical protein